MGDVTPRPHPRFLRGRVAEELRRRRARAGVSQHAAAVHVGWSRSTLQRIETGVTGISVADMRTLIELYGAPDEETLGRLLEMASAARRRDQFTPYRKYLSPE